MAWGGAGMPGTVLKYGKHRARCVLDTHIMCTSCRVSTNTAAAVVVCRQPCWTFCRPYNSNHAHGRGWVGGGGEKSPPIDPALPSWQPSSRCPLSWCFLFFACIPLTALPVIARSLSRRERLGRGYHRSRAPATLPGVDHGWLRRRSGGRGGGAGGGSAWREEGKEGRGGGGGPRHVWRWMRWRGARRGGFSCFL